jgi:hypothetical protein
VVGRGVREDGTLVRPGVVGVLLGVGVSLATSVIPWLGVSDAVTLIVSVAVPVAVEESIAAPRHWAMPINPRLYASKTLYNLEPVSRSLSLISLPAGCRTIHP